MTPDINEMKSQYSEYFYGVPLSKDEEIKVTKIVRKYLRELKKRTKMTPEEIMVHEYKEEMKGCRTIALGLICMAIFVCAVIHLIVRYADQIDNFFK